MAQRLLLFSFLLTVNYHDYNYTVHLSAINSNYLWDTGMGCSWDALGAVEVECTLRF